MRLHVVTAWAHVFLWWRRALVFHVLAYRKCPKFKTGVVCGGGGWCGVVQGGVGEGVVVVVVRTRCHNDVFLHTSARMHLITVAEHMGVRLPVSTPPGPQRPDERRPKNAAFLQQKSPSQTDRRQTRVDLRIRSPRAKPLPKPS